MSYFLLITRKCIRLCSKLFRKILIYLIKQLFFSLSVQNIFRFYLLLILKDAIYTGVLYSYNASFLNHVRWAETSNYLIYFEIFWFIYPVYIVFRRDLGSYYYYVYICVTQNVLIDLLEILLFIFSSCAQLTIRYPCFGKYVRRINLLHFNKNRLNNLVFFIDTYMIRA